MLQPLCPQDQAGSGEAASLRCFKPLQPLPLIPQRDPKHDAAGLRLYCFLGCLQTPDGHTAQHAEPPNERGGGFRVPCPAPARPPLPPAVGHPRARGALRCFLFSLVRVRRGGVGAGALSTAQRCERAATGSCAPGSPRWTLLTPR